MPGEKVPELKLNSKVVAAIERVSKSRSVPQEFVDLIESAGRHPRFHEVLQPFFEVATVDVSRPLLEGLLDGLSVEGSPK